MDRVQALRATDPDMTTGEIAAAIGLSRQRVHQLLRALRLPTVTKRTYLASGLAGKRPPAARLITGGVPTQLSHTVVGTIGELLAAADLAARGYKVFLPITRTGHCDLMTLDESTRRVERIEVRCGHRGLDGKVIWSQPDRSRSDRRAIVLTGEPVVYDPPFRPSEAWSGEPAQAAGAEREEASAQPENSGQNSGSRPPSARRRSPPRRRLG